MRKGFISTKLVVFLIIVVAGIMYMNGRIQKQVSDLGKHKNDIPVNKFLKKLDKKEENIKRSGEVIQKIRLAPERTFEICVFYQGGEEIARHKISKKDGEVFDYEGEIPDGKVKFFNEYDQTYGIEHYRKGKRHGSSLVNYKSGKLKLEASYKYGRLITSKEYFHDGILKMEQDYSDAIKYRDDRETGTGKVYARDGVIKYEWSFVSSDPVSFRKSYDPKGRITSAIYYDEFGVEIPPEKQIDIGGTSPGAGL